MGIRALLQKDSKIHTEHVIEAKDKFSDLLHTMKKEHLVRASI